MAPHFRETLGSVDSSFMARASAPTGPDWPTPAQYADHIRQAAKSLVYVADLGSYHSWCELSLETGSVTDIVVSFHALSEHFSGVVAASVIVVRWAKRHDRGLQAGDWAVACPRVFQVNYLDDPEVAKARFESWLSESLVIALDQWRRWL